MQPVVCTGTQKFRIKGAYYVRYEHFWNVYVVRLCPVHRPESLTTYSEEH